MVNSCGQLNNSVPMQAYCRAVYHYFLLILIQVTGNLVFMNHQVKKQLSMKNMLGATSCLLAYTADRQLTELRLLAKHRMCVS